ncbi:hypothetical protein GCM10025768_03540 [Microbacterium pseudoresistens]|uniref:DNA-binding MarR family transcriptional regulator n=1 Tax=Microbacterium pseudoresistens TaxID=640634 RepID=A0A7Y9JMA8_9MICO|nr:MarR family transcriptional regulator [Microbacterium pseudoresistens]NYD54190.1 DNA-binding MarR family transcriptional regulator [Microbacterium pseudoresistens]
MTAPDPIDAIATALARLRGRGPRGMFGPGRPGGPHGHDGHHPHHGFGGRGPGPASGRGGPWGPDAGRHGAPARLRMLEALAKEALSVSALAEAIGVDQPRASRLVQQGVERGWVRREADPDDARRTRIVLTDDGRRLFRSVRGERREALGAALEALTEAEQAELARLLTKLADNWR